MNAAPSSAIEGKPGVAGLGERLQCVRLMRGMTQAALAKKTGLMKEAVSHFECGQRLPSANNLRKLSLALNTSADYLLDSNT